MVAKKLHDELAEIRQVPLRQQVVDALTRAITECRIEEGGRLKERELCETLGVSRPTLREGLSQLAAEGLVTILPNRGPYVARLTRRDAEELYAIRELLEAQAAGLAAARITDSELAALDAHLTDMRRIAAGDDFFAFQAAKTRFYGAYYDASGNGHLAAMLRQLRARTALAREIDHDRATRNALAVQGMEALVEALRDRDPETARRVVAEHIRRGTGAALAAFDARARQDVAVIR